MICLSICIVGCGKGKSISSDVGTIPSEPSEEVISIPVSEEPVPEEPSEEAAEEKPSEEKPSEEKPSEEEPAEEDTPEEEQTEEEEEPETESSVTANGLFEKSEITEEIKQRINGLSYKADCTVPYEDLRYLKLAYVDFNGNTCSGEMICNKAIADDLLEIFEHLYNAGYQIDKIRLVDEYGADDDLSCDDDNTSCFNYRTVSGSKNLSKHALGMAVDLNPFYNPYVTYPNGNIRITPVGSEAYADRSTDFPHKIDKNDLAYKEFKAHGFSWGGDYKSLKDYQHFYK